MKKVARRSKAKSSPETRVAESKTKRSKTQIAAKSKKKPTQAAPKSKKKTAQKVTSSKKALAPKKSPTLKNVAKKAAKAGVVAAGVAVVETALSEMNPKNKQLREAGPNAVEHEAGPDAT